jgi:hypothetical protein
MASIMQQSPWPIIVMAAPPGRAAAVAEHCEPHEADRLSEHA